MEDPKPKVSIIVPTFNRANFLVECLQSLFDQSLTPHQILVVNDGSTDDTGNILKPYFHRIHYLETPQLGKPGAINEALRKVTGDYVWIFDDDDVALPDALQRFTAPLITEAHLDYSFSSYYFTPNKKNSYALAEPIAEYKLPDLKPKGPLIPLLENNYLGGAALFTRTSCYDKVGHFDPSLVRSQDYEMAIRIVRAFKGVPVDGGPTFHYRQHEGLRGSMRDRFMSRKRTGKWLEYDQVFFKKLYRELSLQDYLPPGRHLPQDRRLALLQRMAILAIKNLPAEFSQDLMQLAEERTEQRALSLDEMSLIRTIAEIPYYGRVSVLSDREVIHTMKGLVRGSSTIKALRTELQRYILRAAIHDHKPLNLWRAFRLI